MGMQCWVADGQKGLLQVEKGACRKIGPPGYALCAAGGKIFCAGEKSCAAYGRAGRLLLETPLPTGVCALAPLGGMICALSSDADSVTAFSAETGETLFSTPAGVYPRDLCTSPCGRFLAAAGGAAGEILLWDGCLRCVKTYRVPGVACGVCFLPRAIAVLCAVGDGELSARLMLISPRGVTEEAFAFPDAPCGLCALPGGLCLVSGPGRVWALRPGGKVAFRVPCGYPVRLRPFSSGALICDAQEGRVTLLTGETVCQTPDPRDAAII